MTGQIDPAVSNADKTIVEKSSNRRISASSRAIKAARTQLTESGSNRDVYRAELLENHARSHLNAKPIIPFLILIASVAAYQWLSIESTIIWASTTLIAYLVLILLSHRYLNTASSERNMDRWQRNMLFAHILSGIAWASLFVIEFQIKAPIVHSIMQFSALLIVMAMSAMLAFNMRVAVMITTAPALVVLVSKFAITKEPAAIAMAVVLVAAKIFFDMLAQRLNTGARDGFMAQAEKDQLIVELETASIISEEARRRAEESNLAKSRFLATMSHELRTPLNAILGFSEVIAKELMGPLENETYKEYVNDIHSSGTHLLALINEILDLSRVEAGRYELHQEPVRLEYIAEESSQMVKLRAQSKDIEIAVQIHPDLPQILADERAIRQIILNLLSNAVKFTPRGGKIVLKVGWTAGGGQYLSVKDNGPGIPEDEIPIVLSSFGQGAIAIKNAEQGTGLGLPIVQALVHMHEGTFELKSKLREGTEVIATFPRRRVMEVMGPLNNDPQQPEATPEAVAIARQKRQLARDIFRKSARRNLDEMQNSA